MNNTNLILSDKSEKMKNRELLEEYFSRSLEMQEWSVLLLDAPVPEQMKYASLAEAASHLMQVLNDPERIIG